MARIAFISALESAPWGGSEELWSQAALQLNDHGNRILTCVRKWRPISPALGNLSNSGIQVIERETPPFPLQKRILHAARRRISPGTALDTSLSNTANQIRSFAPDIICISQGSNTDGLPWMEWCKEEGIPYLSVMQVNAEHLWPEDPVAARLIEAHQNAVATCFVSEGNLQLFQHQVGHWFENAQVVSNPFAVAFDSPPVWPGEEEPSKWACVGRLTPMAKGQDLILEMLSSTKWRERPVKVSFVGDGPMRESIRRSIAHFGLEKKVTLTGQVSSISEVWQSHHALILPSRYEGMPLALIEAMLSQRVPITTNIASHKELVENGKTGFLAAAPTVAHLDDACEAAWQQREHWKEIGMAAATHARSCIPSDPGQRFADLILQSL